MDWLHVFSRSVILFALCFDEVALQHRCLLNYGPRDVFITGWGPEEDFLAWGSSDRAQTLCALLNWSHWACLLEIKKFLIFSISTAEKVCLVAVWSCCVGSHTVLACLTQGVWI